MKLPENDIYVRLVEFATYLDEKPDKKAGKLGNSLSENFPIKIDESIEGSYEEHPENFYVVKKIIKEDDGLLAVIFEREYNDENGNKQKEGVLALGGSFALTKPYKNPVAWGKDWIQNNAKIAQNELPPQFYTALNLLDKYKTTYNINTVTGFSLGAILGGLITNFSKHSDVNAYLYNGGLPVELKKVLQCEYGSDINPDSSNMMTMLTKGDTLTDLMTIERGSGIFLSNRNEKAHRGHKISNHRKLTPSDYDEIVQKSIPESIEYSVSANKTDSGASVQVNVPLYAQKNKKKVSEITDDENDEVNVSHKRIIKEMSKKPKNNGIKTLEYSEKTEDENMPTGYAAGFGNSDTEISDSEISENPELHSEENIEEKSAVQNSATQIPQWNSEISENGDKINRIQYNDPDYGFPVTWEIREKKKKYPPTHLELYEIVEDIVVSLLDDFIRFMGYDEVHKL